MVERGGRLSLRRQSELLGLSRSSLYYTPRGASAEELALMRRLDELYSTRSTAAARWFVIFAAKARWWAGTGCAG